MAHLPTREAAEQLKTGFSNDEAISYLTNVLSQDLVSFSCLSMIPFAPFCRSRKNSISDLDIVYHGNPCAFGEDAGNSSKSESIHANCAILNAAASGNLLEVALLVDRNASVDTADYDKRTALHLSCCEGHDDIVRFLLSRGADANFQDRWGNQPLKDAISHGRVRVVKTLQQAGIALSKQNERDLEQTLCQAAAVGDLDRVKRLILCGVSVDAVDYDRRTALHLAAAGEHSDVVDHLLRCGADPARVGRIGRDTCGDGGGGRRLRSPDSPASPPRSPHRGPPSGGESRASSVASTRPPPLPSGPSSLRVRTYSAGEVTVLLVDIKGFTAECAALSAREAGEWVAAFYERVDAAAAPLGVRKAEVRSPPAPTRLPTLSCRRARGVYVRKGAV